MQVDIENDKQTKLMYLDQQISQTNVTLQQWQEQNLNRFQVFKEKVTSCLKYIETDQQERDYEHEKQLKEIDTLQRSIEERF